MNIDFAFVDARGALCLAGWSERLELEPRLALADGAGIDVLHVTRFRRRDLSSEALLGFVIAWPRRTLGRMGEDASLSIAPVPGDEPVIVASHRLHEDEARLVASGVDEIFSAYLRTIALRRLAPPARAVGEAAIARVQSELRTFPAETPAMAVNLERLMVAPSGVGMGIGWCLSARRVDQPLLGLVSAGRLLRPVHLVPESLPREDLAGYRERYRYTGRDGFFCAFRVPASHDPEARLIILGNAGPTGLVFGRSAEVVSDADAADALGTLRGMLRDPDDEADLMAALAPRMAARPSDLEAAAAADAAAGTGDTLLLLAADVAPWELRDTLRRVAAAVDGPIDVVPVGHLDAAARQALSAAANEAGERLAVGIAIDTATLSEIAPAAGTPVIWGRASAILQLGLPERRPGRGTVLAHDPVGGLGAEPEAPSWARLRGPASVATVSGALFAAALAASPTGLLTPDGVIDAALRVLEHGGRLDVARSAVVTFYPGLADGGGSGGHAPAALDAEMLDLVEQEDHL
ncbi:hypothetical protein GI374_13265 [Paracoccus sp. S-4012]|uniref:hypothetical protein n=1 Tax=Paracoccus sp. S-4012 TaxID=2665648 RepID=UPI0012B02FDC|nr:hypothetical protein [Paracoccus sp. S-4012]MRX51393.1 hypothetical protein [Paracoccus sp. S-4012]